MIKVHHLNHSRSHRILWLLEELNLPYEVISYQRDRNTLLAPPALKAIHPLGRSPVICDGELVLAESGAIIEYLVGKYGNGKLIPPPHGQAHVKYLYWFHFAEGSLMPLLLLKLHFSRLIATPASVLAGINAQIAAQLDYLDLELGASEYLAGPVFSAADIQMSFPLVAAAGQGLLDPGRANSWSYLHNLQQRPAYRAADARGGELKPWRNLAPNSPVFRRADEGQIFAKARGSS
jgi:glutathione S-transferase